MFAGGVREQPRRLFEPGYRRDQCDGFVIAALCRMIVSHGRQSDVSKVEGSQKIDIDDLGRGWLWTNKAAPI